jgi:hypothetical protein
MATATARADPPFSTNNVGGTPLALTAGAERSVAFTIPSDSVHGTGTYVIEVDADGDGTAPTQSRSRRPDLRAGAQRGPSNRFEVQGAAQPAVNSGGVSARPVTD